MKSIYHPLLKKRVLAFITDMAIIVVSNYFLMASFTHFLKIVFFHFPLSIQLHLIQKFNYIHSTSLLSLMFSYFTLFYYTTNGQTMGKMLQNLRVKGQTEEMNLKQAMLRAAAYIFCALLGSLPHLVPFLRKDQRSLADLFSQTSVLEIDISDNDINKISHDENLAA